MTALLDEPRIAYASRKVQRLREDLKEWHGESGVLEDQIRDLNRVAEDLLAVRRTGVAVDVHPVLRVERDHVSVRCGRPAEIVYRCRACRAVVKPTDVAVHPSRAIRKAGPW